MSKREATHRPKLTDREQRQARMLLAHGLTPTGIAEAIGRSRDGVSRYLAREGLRQRLPQRGRAWTPAEDAAVRRDYRRIPAREIAAAVGHTAKGVMDRARRLGLARPRQAGGGCRWRMP